MFRPALLGLLGLLIAPAQAGTNLWTKGSGADANISSLAANPLVPNVVYATSGALLLKSGDGGNNWVSLQKLLSDQATLSLVVPSPQAPDYVFVGQSAWGVGRSIYGGKDDSWRMQNGSAPYTAGNGFSCPIPSAPPLVYNFDGTVDDDQITDLGPDEAVGGGDDDATLTPLYCPDNNAVSCHAYPPVAGDYILYGSRPSIGGYDIAARIPGYCTNPAIPHAGDTNTSPRSLPPGAVTALAFSRSNSNFGFAAYQGKGIYVTDNALRTVLCPYRDPDSSNTVNGVDPDLPWACSDYNINEPDLWTENYRVNWGSGGTPLAGGPELPLTHETANTLVVRETSAGNFVYAALNGGGIRMRSGAYNAAGAWSLQSCGAAGDTGNVCNVQTLKLSPDQSRLWAGTLNNGIWRADVSAGAPASWTRVDVLSAGHACYSALRNVRALAFANLFDSTTGTSKTRVYAGSHGQGICISEDDGVSWAAFNDGLTDPATGSLFGLYVTALEVDPFNPARVHAGTFAGVYSIQTINGGVGGLTLAPTSLSFGALPVGQASALTVTLTTGSQDVGLAELNLPSGFAMENGCGTYIPAGSSCPLTVTFAPTAATSYGGNLLILLSGATTPLSVPLSGSGTTSSSSLAVSPTALAYGALAVGQSSLKTLTVSAGGSDVTISEVTAPTGFELLSGCDEFVPAGGSCLISVIFKPTQIGPYGGHLLIRTSASSSPVSVPLSGSGSLASATPITLKYADGTAIVNETHDFGTVAKGSQSLLATFMLTAPEALLLDTPVTSNPDVFQVVSQNCNRVADIDLQAGQSCTFSLRYKPGEQDNDEAFLMLSPVGASGQSYSVFLALKGASASIAAPVLNVSPTSLAFGNVAVGQGSMKTVTLAASSAGIALTEITAPTNFELVSGCGDYIPAGGSCLINVIFRPHLIGPFGGNLLIRTSASSTPVSVPLSGSGSVASATPLTLKYANGAPIVNDTHDFGVIHQGSQSDVVTFMLTAPEPLNIDTPTTSNPEIFQVISQNCSRSIGIDLLPGQSCTFSLRYKPGEPGNDEAFLMLSPSGASERSYSVFLILKGATSSSSSNTYLALDTNSISFGTLRPGSSLSRSLLVTASGGDLVISNIEAPLGYGSSHTCGNTLPAGGRCEINVNFSPANFGSYQGSLLIYSNAAGSPHSVSLSGRGADATSLSGAARGNAGAYDLTGHFRFSEWDARGGGYYYVYYERNGERFFFNGRSWTEASGEARPPFVKAGRFNDFDTLIFNAANVRALSGTTIFMGYGSNQEDMLNNFKFSPIAVLP